jgi:hypothetical protein
VARELVLAWRPPRALRARLVERARRTFTQGHLLQHMLFHPVHSRELTRASTAIVGLRNRDVIVLLHQGQSRAEIGQAHGFDRAHMVSTATAAVERAQQLGLAKHETPPAEGQRELDTERVVISPWLDLRHNAAINPQREITPGARSAVAAALCHLD